MAKTQNPKKNPLHHNLSTRLVPLAAALTILFLLTTSCLGKKIADYRKKRISRSVQKAVGWVQRYPASFRDGMFLEIAEETITFYVMSRYAESSSEKKVYLEEIKKRLDLIVSNRELKIQPTDYTAFLAITAISEKLGLNYPTLRQIIESQLIPDPHLYPAAHLTTCIWSTVYLQRLGYTTPTPLEKFWPQSTLSKEVRQQLILQSSKAQKENPDKRFVDSIALTVYDMTHEIFSLTDFGELPPPPLISEKQAFFSELFNHSIEWAITVTHEDVLAEIIMCVKMLNFKDVASVPRGVNYLISRQQKDGSFGISNPGRPNVYRHGVLMAMMALIMSR